LSGPSAGHAWRALRHRNFKLYFAGQGISIIGTWMTRMATTWLVYRLTHSPLLLGVVGFAGLIPTFVLAPFAGVWIERLERRRLLVWTQAAAGMQSLILAALTLARVVTFREILVLAVFQGLINAFDTPLRQLFVGQMVDDREDLGNAIAISSSLANGARLIGPAIAGLVIAGFGEGGCFLIDGISYLAVIASLVMMRLQPQATRPNNAGMLEQMREGFGALGSGLSLAFRRSIEGLTRMLQIAATALGGGLILFGLSHTLWLSMGLMVLIGFGMMQVFAASNTLIQTLVPEDKKGRVMSYFVMSMFGTAPFGSLLAGALAHRIGAPHTVFVTGAFCLAGSFWFGMELPAVQAVLQATP